MAFRRADNGPTLNAGLLALWFFRGSGPVLLRNPACIFVTFREEGSGPPVPLWIHPRVIYYCKILSSLCSWAGWFEHDLAVNPGHRFSRDEIQTLFILCFIRYAQPIFFTLYTLNHITSLSLYKLFCVLNSTEHELSTAYKTKVMIFLAFNLIDVVSIMLITVKMPTIVGILTFMSMINVFQFLSWA